MSTTNLSDMFGGSAKAGNLSGLLPARPKPAAPPQPAVPQQPQPEPVVGNDPVEAEPQPAASRPSQVKTRPESRAESRAEAWQPERRSRAGRGEEAAPARATRRTRKEPAPAVGEEDTTQVSVYLLPAAKAAAKRLREEQGALNAEIVFDAIDAMSFRLGELVQAMQYEPRNDDSLFPARSTRRRARSKRQSGRPSRTLWTLQVTPAEHEVLDGLVLGTGANGISQLISAAVEAYLLEESEEQARRR